MSVKNLLVELFVEELPPKALKKLGEDFASLLADSLKDQGLAAADASITPYATPRRLAAHITQVADKAADKPVSQKLMPAAVGLDASGQATPALIKKLAALGADASVVPKLKRENDGKTDVLFLDAITPGATLTDGLQKALEETLAKLPIPKVMTYQLADGWNSVNFVRPAHGLVALHGSDVVQVSVLGLASGNSTQGHRFEASVPEVVIKNADSYEQQLQGEGAVTASFAARRAEIERQLKAAAAKENLEPIEDDALLEEVTALVERPNVLVGQFEESFLEVPQECLILTMKANQKYFPLLDAKGKLTNKFLIVSNISPADPSAVIGGNERVVRPRLADAKFFFDQDRKKMLESRIPGLDKVVYHNKLGSQGERILRVRAIAKAIGQQLGGDQLAAQADQAAMLAKADLLTDMVGEFPELQGIMGRYYAQYEKLAGDIAYAIEDHYKPRFAGDELPRSTTSITVALADKLETLIGMFKINEIPTGDKDPFALRRHALGVLRICMEHGLRFSLEKLVDDSSNAWDNAQAVADNKKWSDRVQKGITEQRPNLALSHESFSAQKEKALQSLLGFMRDRFAVMLRDQGFSTNEVDAVLSVGSLVVADAPKRLAAVRAFAAMPESESLAAANKRVGNILKKAEEAVEAKVDGKQLKEPAEIALNKALSSVKPEADKLFENGDYTASLQALAVLKAPVDDFFDNVMVNAEDPALRANRLALLSELHVAMNRVADLSKLAG